jgi:virulence-associated protein VagC
MQRRAKIFRNNRSQAVRLPKEFQFDTDEVFIRKEGEDVILSPRPTDWGPRAHARAPARHEQHCRVRQLEGTHARELDAARSSHSCERRGMAVRPSDRY